MLVLTRRLQETIVIDGRIRVTVVKAGGRAVRLGIDAPGDVAIHRGEVFQRIQPDPPATPSAGKMEPVPALAVQAESPSPCHAPPGRSIPHDIPER